MCVYECVCLCTQMTEGAGLGFISPQMESDGGGETSDSSLSEHRGV